jgi:hypothetical protein
VYAYHFLDLSETGQARCQPSTGDNHSLGLAQGNCVGVDHGQGVVSLMMHLKSVHVKPGDYIRMGNKLGEVGNTGLSTGAHQTLVSKSRGRETRRKKLGDLSDV